jgi:hypothetical protein
MKTMRLPIVCLICLTVVPAADAARMEMDSFDTAMTRQYLAFTAWALGLGAATALADNSPEVPLTCAAPTAISTPDPRPADPRLRLAQSGSAGGTLGKKDQSLSGGQQSKEPPAQRERKQPSYSLSGTWDYTQDCQVGTYRGSFQISQTGASSFRGTANQVSPKISTSLVNGVINGNRISFNATFSSFESWSGTLSGSGRMQGTVTTSSVGNCTWRASRS